MRYLASTLAAIAGLAALAQLGSCGSAGAPVSPASAPRVAAAYDPLAPLASVPLGVDNVKTLPGTARNGRTVVAATALDTLDSAVQRLLVLDGAGRGLRIGLSGSTPHATLYVRYDGAREHLAGSVVGRGEFISLVHEVEPGLIAVGLSTVAQAGLPAGAPLLELTFAPGARELARSASTITSHPRAKVEDLTVVDNGDTSATLQWGERNPGDYDLNGEVNAADMVRISQTYQRTYTPGSANAAQLEVIDGDGNGEINQAEITVIAQNFRSFIRGYNVYRTPLNTPDEEPLATEAGRWTKVVNAAAPAGPSAPREFNGQDFRLVYTFLDSSGAGDYGWYVCAAGPDNNEEGIKSSVVTSEVGSGAPPEAGLGFEIMPPQGGTIAPGSDIYIAVNVTGAVGLFSANVRFEYDSTLLQFVEVLPSYNDGTDHPNILSPPLFVGADNVGTAASPYRLLGFNATQTLGTPTVTADGALGYVHFTAIGNGVNSTAIRFPQSSNFIYLWGVDYGVPVLTPALGDPLAITVIP